MQNEFDGYNNMEEQRVDVGQEERKEQRPERPASASK